MSLSRCLSVLALVAMVGQATAQLVPPPATSTIINFDELTLPDQIAVDNPGTILPPDTYVNRGILITGFGNSGGVGLNVTQEFSVVPGISSPNSLVFASI